MLELIGRLVDAGFAYETGTGVYMEVGKVEGYGLLARQSLDSLQSGARIDVDEEKRSPLDFVLWKKAKPGEPEWPSPWGPGRPGWHTECVVMSLDLLGDGFDLHGGGIDLAFPHHENERAQAVAEGRTFARHWAHNGFVEVEGEKMSKSLGNFTNLLDLIESTDPRAYRLLVLRAHYRTPLEISKATTDDASAQLRGFDALARRATAAGLPPVDPDAAALDRFRELMDDDLDTAKVVALLADLRTRANTALDDSDLVTAAGLYGAFAEICDALGLVLATGDDDVPESVQALARERDEARAAKDWGRADALRDQLVADGWLVEDTPNGTQVRPA
jgi:cysteinyl-tRNA synthetase